MTFHRRLFPWSLLPGLFACAACALPFDRAATVARLREKLFTRIKDEGERRTIREFLAQNPTPPG